MEVSPLIVNIVRYTARLIGTFSVRNKRARIAHIEPQIFLEICRSLTNAGVSDSVIAEMLGLSYPTYRARLKTYQRDYELSISSSSALWLRVICFLRKQNDWCSREDIVVKNVQSSGDNTGNERLIRGILTELESLHWVEVRGGARKNRFYRWRGEGELTRRTMVALVRQQIFQFGPLTQEAIQDALALDEKQVGSILDDLLAAGEITEDCKDVDCLYHCNGLNLGPPSSETLDAAVLDHFQAMALALTDKMSGNVNPNLPPVGGSTFTLELWPGHPFEARIRDTFERCRRDLSQLRQEMQDMKTIIKGAGKEPDRSHWYTLKVYIGQHVLGSHNLSHVQGNSPDATENRTPSEEHTAVAVD